MGRVERMVQNIDILRKVSSITLEIFQKQIKKRSHITYAMWFIHDEKQFLHDSN